MANKIVEKNMLKVGTMLNHGKYRIDAYLASGGFGNTYVATDTAFDEKIAIKELFIKGVCGRQTDKTGISISLSENQRAFAAQQEKFKKEARRLRKLNNPHIIKVHDLFDENETSYYVMNFVEGESLSARMKRTKKPMQESELMLILPQILDALECVHNDSIWHLDLKPANIMIDTKGNMQLIDFGASKQLKNTNGESLSTSSAMTYTPGFAPSEQTEQSIEKFGPWTDLYSLGATLYNLLTMQQPPLPSDISEKQQSAFNLPSNISKKTEQLIVWLMQPIRTMRPRSVAEVKQFLEEVDDTPSSKKSDNTENANDTIKIEKKSKTHGNTPKHIKEKNGMIKYVDVLVAFVLFCIGGGIYGVNLGNTNEAEPEVVDSPEISMKNVADYTINVTVGPDNMRKYSYTGELVDTLGALPNGKGIAKFDKYGNIPASTYEGEFVDGVCEDNTGNATMAFTTGDKYIGTFNGGYYGRGKYILADKSYFEGEFKNGNPFNGKWYTAAGAPDGEVVNGEDK